MRWKIGFILLLSLGGLLRYFLLTPDALFFGDEGHYLQEARFLFGLERGRPSDFAKPFYSFLLGLGLWFGKNHIQAAQMVQAFLGLAWIPMVFFLTLKITRNSLIAWLAALFTSVDPWILFYTRHLFPDIPSGLFWMASLFFMIRKENLNLSELLISAILFGLSLATNYRMLVFLPGNFLLLLWVQTGDLDHRIKRCLMWGGAVLVILFGIVFLYGKLCSGQCVNYFEQLVQLFQIHNTGQKLFSIDLLKTYPTLLFRLEGIALVFFLLAAFLPLQNRWDKILFNKMALTIYGTALVIFPFIIFFPYARVWAPLLFWHPILAAIGVFQIGILVEKKFRLLKALPVILCTLVLFFSWFPKNKASITTKIPYQKALTWIEDREKEPPSTLVVAPSLELLQQLAAKGEVGMIKGHPLMLYQLKERGYHYILLDPYQFTRTGKESLAPNRSPLGDAIQKACPLLARWDCNNAPSFWKWFAWEHNVSYSETIRFLKEMDPSSLPCLEVYDFKSCVFKK